ncbi:MAG: hypothetical protein KDC53_13755, partial [Saprospiraceae bacterium]|nr:hypothetical protein [Saprospiraceae bacterium]
MSSSPEMIRKKVKVSDSIGDISTLTILPPSPKYLMILGHGAGANMEHHFMQGLAEVLAEYGI